MTLQKEVKELTENDLIELRDVILQQIKKGIIIYKGKKPTSIITMPEVDYIELHIDGRNINVFAVSRNNFLTITFKKDANKLEVVDYDFRNVFEEVEEVEEEETEEEVEE
jgi:hypothetical protein